MKGGHGKRFKETMAQNLPNVKKTINPQGLHGGSNSKESACNEGDPGPVPGSERSPGEGNGYPLQYSCLQNAMDTGPGNNSP